MEKYKVWLDTWFQNLKFKTARWRVSQNIRWCLPLIAHIHLELDHTLVWYLQGDGGKVEPLKFYTLVEYIFVELTQQSNTKLYIPPIANKVDQPIIEPLTDREEKVDYEFWLPISIFYLVDTRIE